MGVHDTRERQATTTFVARLDPRSRAQERESIELVVDTARLHFFDPQTGLGIDDREGIRMNRKRWVVGVATVAILALVAAACSSRLEQQRLGHGDRRRRPPI